MFMAVVGASDAAHKHFYYRGSLLAYFAGHIFPGLAGSSLRESTTLFFEYAGRGGHTAAQQSSPVRPEVVEGV